MTVEEIIVGYLIGKNIPGIFDHVYAERPGKPEPAYVLVRRSGGSEKDFVRTYLIHIDVCVKRDEEAGQDKLLALKLHEEVMGAMKSAPEATRIYGCRKNADYDATRAETKEYRYQSLWIITM